MAKKYKYKVIGILNNARHSYYGYTIPNDKIQAKLDKIYKEAIKRIK